MQYLDCSVLHKRLAPPGGYPPSIGRAPAGGASPPTPLGSSSARHPVGDNFSYCRAGAFSANCARVPWPPVLALPGRRRSARTGAAAVGEVSGRRALAVMGAERNKGPVAWPSRCAVDALPCAWRARLCDFLEATCLESAERDRGALDLFDADMMSAPGGSRHPSAERMRRF
jgi:hypothetical protein